MQGRLTVEQIARVCHEANKGYCDAIGDFSQKSWEQAEEWQRQSMIRGVRAVIAGTAETPEQQHEAWCADKRAEGWTYGHIKNAEAKTHPALLPYAELPIEQRRKDFISRAIIEVLSR